MSGGVNIFGQKGVTPLQVLIVNGLTRYTTRYNVTPVTDAVLSCSAGPVARLNVTLKHL